MALPWRGRERWAGSRQPAEVVQRTKAGGDPRPHLPRYEATVSPSRNHPPLPQSSSGTAGLPPPLGPSPGSRLQLLQGFRNKTTNSQDTFFCVNKDLDLPATAATPGQGPDGDFGLRQSPSPGAPRRRGSPMAPSWMRPGLSKATSRRWCCGGNTFTAALSISLSAFRCRAAEQPRGQRNMMAKRRRGHCSETWKVTGPGAPSKEPWAASQKPHAGAHGHLQPRTSSQSTPRSRRTLLPTNAQPQARCKHVAQLMPRLREQTSSQLQHWHRRVGRGRHQRGHPCPHCPSRGKAAAWWALKRQRVLSPGSGSWIHL